MAITPKNAGQISTPNSLTAETAGSVAVPNSLTPESAGSVAVPNSLTAESAGSVAVPNSLTAESTGTVAAPNSLTAETAGTVAVPNSLTAQSAASVAVPNSLSSSTAGIISRTLVPTLDIDFQNQLYTKNNLSRSSSDLFTYSRNSEGTFINRRLDVNGQWEYFVDTDYVGTVTNLAIYSEQFDNAAWTNVGLDIVPNATKAPDGSYTADKLTVLASGNNKGINQSIIMTTGVHNVGVYAKANGVNWIKIFDPDGGGGGVWFDLLYGEIGTTSAGQTAKCTPVGDGWFLCQLSSTAAVSGTLKIELADTDNTISSTAGNGVFLWGAQATLGTKPKEYVKSISTQGSETLQEEIRIEYDPVSGNALGALIESSATNLLIRSEEFSDPTWVTAGSPSITDNAHKSPDGSTSADKFSSALTATNAPSIINTAITSTASSPYTFSLFVKRSEIIYIQVTCGTGQVSGDPRVNFDIANGSIGAQDANIDNATITPIDDNWYRLSVTVTAATTSLAFNVVLIKSSTDARQQTNSWVAGEGLYLWGAQLEQEESATSYIRTEGSTASRLSDNLTTVNTGAVPVDECTFFVDANIYENITASRYIYSVADAGAGAILMSITSGGSLDIQNGGSSRTLAASGAYGTSFKAVSVFNSQANTITGYLNGTSTGSSSAGLQTVPDLTGNMGIGNISTPAANQLNGHIKKLSIYDTVLTSTEISQL